MRSNRVIGSRSKKKRCPACGGEIGILDPRREVTILTIHGELPIVRAYWYCRACGHSEYSDDDIYKIGRLPHRMTKELMLQAAFFAQNQPSFEKASEIICRFFKVNVCKETIREVADEIGGMVFAEDTARAEATLDGIQHIASGGTDDGTLYIMMDGAAVNTRVEDDNGSTWRENKTVMAFTDRNMIKRVNGDRAITKKEYLPFIGKSEDFKKYVLDIAVRAGYGKMRETVIIADGATWIRNMCDEIFPDAVQILDLFHLKENIYAYAKHIFNQDASKFVPWVEKIIDLIEAQGKADEALSLIPDCISLPPGIVNLKTYIENNREKINYPVYKRRDFFVGSGAIESANKTIVQQRLKRAGMRWSVKGAQALLTLRAKDESKLWGDVVQSVYMCA